jgi:hypothetical protein
MIRQLKWNQWLKLSTTENSCKSLKSPKIVGKKMHKPINKNHKPPYLPEKESQGSKQPYRRVKNRGFPMENDLDSWLAIENEFSYSNRVQDNNAEIS